MALSTPIATAAEATVFLKTSDDWDDWFLMVKLLARQHRIERFVDITKPEVPEPTEPQMPEYSDIKPNAAVLINLDTHHVSLLRLLMERHRYELQSARTTIEALKFLGTYIISTIDRSHLMHLDDATTIYQMLLILKKRLAPTDRARRIEVIRRYREMQKAPKIYQRPTVFKAL